MSEIFLKIVNMSISASWIVVAVLLLRFLLKKAPKWTLVLLWGIVALRLICPFSIESAASLIPSAETIRFEENAPRPDFESGVAVVDTQVNEYLNSRYYEGVTRDEGHFTQLTVVLAWVWTIGMALLLIYTLVSYLSLKGKIGTAVLLRDNIYQSEKVASPFVLGVIKPKIYLPFCLQEQEMVHVIAHEEAHIKRKDHLWKPFGFLLLTLHWFNPVIWLGYVLLCRDIEFACDEKVIKELDREQKADYSQALLTCSVNRRSIAACPLAFGETGVKERVKSVLSYKKPAFWIVAVAVLACVIVAVCFLTNPPTSPVDELSVFIDMEIAGHNQTEDTGTNFCAVHHKVLGMDRSGDKVTVYLWAMYQEYSFKNGEITEKSGSRSPIVITAKQTGKHGHYELVEYWQPRDGAYYVEDIKEKFPMHLHGKALDSQRYVDEQREFCRKSAEECFAQVGGADDPVKTEIDGHPYFVGEIKEIYEASLLVEAVNDAGAVRKGSQYYVSTKVKNEIALPDFKIGLEIAVVYDGQIQETYPMQISSVYAIYEVDELRSITTHGMEEKTLKGIPAMIVVSNEQSIVAQNGSCSLTYKDENGKAVNVSGDGTHPENAKKTMPYIDILPSYFSNLDPLGAYLVFNVTADNPTSQVPPDDFTILCWEEDEWGKAGANGETVGIDLVEGNFFFKLKEGDYVYEVTALWNDNGSYGGMATYVFGTKKSDLNWSGYPKIGEGSKAVKTYLVTETEQIKESYEKGEYVISKTYHQMDDGLWVCKNYAYLYCLELTGKGSGMEKDTTFIILSNRKNITFDEVWKAEFSSNTEDFFDPREAVTVAKKVSQ